MLNAQSNAGALSVVRTVGSPKFFNDSLHFIVSKMLFKDYLVNNVPAIYLVDSKNYLINMPKTHHSHGLMIHLNYHLKNTLLVDENTI